MRLLLQLFKSGVIYFCVATVLAVVVGVTALWLKGSLNEDKVFAVLAASYDVDMNSIKAKLEDADKSKDQEQISYRNVLEQRTLASLDLDLRETALDKGLLDLSNLQSKLETNQFRFTQLKEAYDKRLKELGGAERSTSLMELQRTLESIRPRQAKEQILSILDDGAMDDVVTIIKAMPLDKRKKIIAEFKDPGEEEKLAEILRNLRMGEPAATEIEEAREQLKQFNPTQ